MRLSFEPVNEQVDNECVPLLWIDRAVQLGHGPHEDFVMFKAYFDESGIHLQKGYFVLCGFLGKVIYWRKFEREWRSVLKKYETEEFHAKDFYSRNSDDNPVGIYKHLTRPQADSFISELVQTIPITRLKTIGSIVDLEDFKSLTHDERRFSTGGKWRNGKWTTSGAPSKPYFLAFEHCVAQACWLIRLPNKVGLVFDRQDTFAPLATELFDYLSDNHLSKNYRNKMGDLLFSSRRDAVALQAADLLVYLINRRANTSLNSDQRRVLRSLCPEKTTEILHHDRVAMLEKYEFPPGIERSAI